MILRSDLILSLALLPFATEAVAQSATADCEFTRICQVQFVCNSDTIEMRFALDLQSEEASVYGNQGANDVQYVLGLGDYPVVSFMEVLGTGAVQTTTITGAGEAVHSRHTVISPFLGNDDAIAPSQYSGSCELRGFTW